MNYLKVNSFVLLYARLFLCTRNLFYAALVNGYKFGYNF